MPRSELYCVDSGRAVANEGDRCLSHGAAPVMCFTSTRDARCKHLKLSLNHPDPVCVECGVNLSTME